MNFFIEKKKQQQHFPIGKSAGKVFERLHKQIEMTAA
jgi:hypothetical protein